MNCLIAILLCLVQNPDWTALRSAFRDAAAATAVTKDALTDEYITLSDHGRMNDVLLLQLYTSVHLPEDEVEWLLDLFSEDGTFSDIDYADQHRGKWPASLHLTRMQALAKLYVSKGSPWYQDTRLREVLHRGAAWWCTARPKNPNWWHNVIGVPKKLGTVLVMLYDEWTPEELAAGIAGMDQCSFGMTGQNKVWRAGNMLMKGLLTEDGDLVRKAVDTMAEEIVVTEDEGIQPDGSFHQHGPQLQFGNYGLAYAEGLSFWERALDGTPYAFTDAQRQILETFILDGLAWTFWRGQMDPSSCGRQLFRSSLRGKALSFVVTADNLAHTSSEQRELFGRLAEQTLHPGAVEALTGARYFPRSDYGIYRTPGWYASVRMHSERTIGFEFTNRENLGGWFTADGALLTLRDGQEYTDIFPEWDWRMIPGVTAYDDGTPLKTLDGREDKENHTAHVGGLAAGEVLCTTMEINRDGLHALKAMFFFPDGIVALGTDIHGTPQMTVTTALEQNRLNGEVWQDGQVRAWHRGKGYVSLDGHPLQVTAGPQEGDWGLLDPAFAGQAQQGDVFRCWIAQDSSHYAYAVYPDISLRSFRRAARRPRARVLSNDRSCQSVAWGAWTCIVDHTGTPSIRILHKGREVGRTELSPLS